MSESPIHASTGEPPELHGAWKASELAHRIMWVVWPAFLVAGFAEVVFFTLVDPEELHFFGDTLELSRRAIYTVGFFCFWSVCTLSSGLTMYLACPPENGGRETGNGKRESGEREPEKLPPVD